MVLQASYTTLFTESMLARIHFEIRVNSKEKINYDRTAIEKELKGSEFDVGSIHYALSLIEQCGEEQAVDYYNRYAEAFPVSYQEMFPGMQHTVYDIQKYRDLIG